MKAIDKSLELTDGIGDRFVVEEVRHGGFLIECENVQGGWYTHFDMTERNARKLLKFLQAHIDD